METKYVMYSHSQTNQITPQTTFMKQKETSESKLFLLLRHKELIWISLGRRHLNGAHFKSQFGLIYMWVLHASFHGNVLPRTAQPASA